MKAFIVYDSSGEIQAVTFPTDLAEDNMVLDPGNGFSLVEVDTSAVAGTEGFEDEASLALALVSGYRIDPSGHGLVSKAS